MTFTTCFIADPLLAALALDKPNYQQYMIKARSIVMTLPPTDQFTVAGNNQIHSLCYQLWCDILLNPAHPLANTHPVSIHPAAQQRYIHPQRQFTPLYKKWSKYVYDRYTKTSNLVITPGTVLAEGDKDTLVNANALQDAWTRAFNTRKFIPDAVVVLDPYNRLATQAPTAVQPMANRVSYAALANAHNDCIVRGTPVTVITL